jgi:Na+-translocating ferredoxin:NAD+ oxidoreductase RnfD subunit
MNGLLATVQKPFWLLIDPRYYQIAELGSLLSFGIAVLGFDITAPDSAVVFTTALGIQFVAGRLAGLERFDPLSPVITSLSLTLLLRADAWYLFALAAVVAIGSKFLLRVRGKHVFNPANAGIVAAIALSEHAWISSGQWGSAAIGAFAFCCLGFLVLTRARRAETTLAFLAAYAVLVFGRAFWLGDPLAIPLHQLQNGALLLFAFFMISDPKTSPDSAPGRIAYGTLVAAVAFVIQFVYFVPGAPVLALILCAPAVPLIDTVRAGRRYDWQSPRPRAASAPAGRHYRPILKGVRQ